MSDHHSSSKARSLIERGDMGIEPGKRYPEVHGDDLYSQIWRATNGATEADHKRHLYWLRKQEQDARPHIYLIKRMARRKLKNSVPPTIGFIDTSFDEDLPRNLTVEQFINLYSAVAFANSGGIILGAHVIIAWKLAGYEDHNEISAALGDKFIKHYSQWCRDNELSPLWVYTHECSTQMGLHTHFLCAVPEDLTAAFRKWVNKRLGEISRIKPLPKRVVKVVAPPSNRLDRQWRMFQYICKGVVPYGTIKSAQPDGESVFVADLIQFAYESPGEIKCKNREGTSAFLGPSNRKKVGFQSLLEQRVLDVRRLYGWEVYHEWQRWCARQELPAIMDSLAGL